MVLQGRLLNQEHLHPLGICQKCKFSCPTPDPLKEELWGRIPQSMPWKALQGIPMPQQCEHLWLQQISVHLLETGRLVFASEILWPMWNQIGKESLHSFFTASISWNSAVNYPIEYAITVPILWNGLLWRIFGAFFIWLEALTGWLGLVGFQTGLCWICGVSRGRLKGTSEGRREVLWGAGNSPLTYPLARSNQYAIAVPKTLHMP